MMELCITGTVVREMTVCGTINKGIGMGELPQAAGLRDFPSPAYAVNGADLTAVGAAISQKSGVEAPVFPQGFVSAVEGIEIPVRWEHYFKRPSGLFFGAESPEVVEMEFPIATHFVEFARDCNGIKSVSVKAETPIVSIQYFVYSSPSVEIATIVGTFQPSAVLSGAFSNCSKLHTVDADLPLSTSWAQDMFMNPIWNSPAIENIRYTQNSSPASLTTIYHQWQSKLSDASVVSLANGLSANTGTLSLHADVKARCETILGTVSTVADGEASYDLFTADKNGDTTLTEFITQVKGWTLA